ncbi:MAG: 50S ribosomal protein L30 [Magnetococcales bacterium]|nr:50S ribosomal protein L30 [Magnetococcales bacterium]
MPCSRFALRATWRKSVISPWRVSDWREASKMANTIKVEQVRSLIGRPAKHRLIVRGLGLKRIRHVRELQDTETVRGMIAKVPHLVRVVE